MGRLEICSGGYKVSDGRGGYDDGGRVMDLFMKELMVITEELMVVTAEEVVV